MNVDVAQGHSARFKPTVASPIPSLSLSRVHVTDALNRSPDDGATLDFAKQNITDVGESAVQELASLGREDLDEDESSVHRIALAYNRLTTLPMGFALLSRLRYLNLKNNNFSIFPEVLTVMPALDTLDISHNKIKRLPFQAGSLVNLQVFNFSRNKLIRVPSYFSKLRNLEILKLDRNPIEWPPKSVIEPPQGALNTPQGMKDWINALQKWLDARTELAPNHLLNGQNGSEPSGDERSWRTFHGNGHASHGDVAPHSRSFSRDSNFSMGSIEESTLESQASSSSLLDRPHLAHLSTNRPRSVSPSPSRVADSYLPSPEESTDGTFGALTDLIRQQQQQQPHARNASLNVENRSPAKKDLSEQTSMPDLRTARINFSRKALESDRVLADTRRRRKQRQFTDDSSDGPSLFLPPKPFARDPIIDSPTSSDHPAPSMDVERNSYFRRFSALTSTTISTVLPIPLVRFIDAARSILFAVSQVYQTLRHYTVCIIDDRLASVLRKVLDPASSDMMHLISSLDRFDSISRKALPSPRVCRAVAESCKDTVSAFGKAVGVLSLQLRVLATRDDIRYIRLMLLTLYGATGEISYSWQVMVPQIDAVKPLIQEKKRRLLRSKPHVPASPTPIALHSASSAFPSLRHPQERPVLSRAHSDELLNGLGIGRTHTARRHAGSFSSKDVEIGKGLPSYEPVPVLPTGVSLPRTTALRVTKRQGTSSSLNPPPAPPSSAPVNSSFSPPTGHNLGSPTTTGIGIRTGKASLFSHSRHGSQASVQTSSASASSSSHSNLAHRPAHLDLPLSSRGLVDKEALDAMKVAVEAAPGVWEMVQEVLADVMETNADIRESFALAKIVTKRLGEDIVAMQRGDSIADKRTLREDAHLFVKTVVQLSNAIKTHGTSHAVSSSLRSKMVTLTNATEEFVILLHVSSFSPAPASRTYSPTFTPSSWAAQRSPLASAPSVLEDSRLGASISRNRSALPGSSLKVAIPSRNGGRSALPAPVPIPSPRQPERRGTGVEEHLR